MTKTLRKFTADQKAAIVRRHLKDNNGTCPLCFNAFVLTNFLDTEKDMTKLRLNTNGDVNFKNQIIQMVEEIKLNQVAMVVRWDRDDKLVWTFNSLPKGQDDVPGGGACHAEEVMLVRWAGCAHINNGRLPKLVEIMITMSPCLDRSQPRNMLGSRWPQGCAQKLMGFISTEPTTTEWNICYYNAYQEDTYIPAQSAGAIALLRTIKSVDIYKFSDRHGSL